VIEFEWCIAKLFKQTHGTRIKLDLKKVIFFDSQPMMDLICDQAPVESTFKSSHNMQFGRKARHGILDVKEWTTLF
jgi:hypothetical protein